MLFKFFVVIFYPSISHYNWPKNSCNRDNSKQYLYTLSCFFPSWTYSIGHLLQSANKTSCINTQKDNMKEIFRILSIHIGTSYHHWSIRSSSSQIIIADMIITISHFILQYLVFIFLKFLTYRNNVVLANTAISRSRIIVYILIK